MGIITLKCTFASEVTPKNTGKIHQQQTISKHNGAQAVCSSWDILCMFRLLQWCHMSVIGSQITGNVVVNSAACSGEQQRKHENSPCGYDKFPHKWSVMRKAFLCVDVITFHCKYVYMSATISDLVCRRKPLFLAILREQHHMRGGRQGMQSPLIIRWMRTFTSSRAVVFKL